MSKAYQTPPSSLLRLDRKPDSDYLCWCLDESIFLFGSFVDRKLDEVQDEFLDNDTKMRKTQIKRAMQIALHEILSFGEDTETEEIKGIYSDPVTAVKQRQNK